MSFFMGEPRLHDPHLVARIAMTIVLVVFFAIAQQWIAAAAIALTMLVWKRASASADEDRRPA